jgi:integrase
VASAWFERFVVGAAGRVRPRPRSVDAVSECLGYLSPLTPLSLERVRRPVVEDLITTLAARAPRRAEMALALLKRILRDAEERGQPVDPSVFRVRIAKPAEREPRFLTWDEAEEVSSWMPEYVRRIVPIAVLILLRRGEILGLRDADLDLEAGSVSVFAQHQDRRARRDQDPLLAADGGHRPAGGTPPSRAADGARSGGGGLPVPLPGRAAL